MKGTITDRDLAVIQSLYRFGYLSFRQIERRHFPGLNKATIHNRLTQLQKRGLLTRTRVGRLFHHLENREIGVVFRPTKTAIQLLKALKPDLVSRVEPVSISTIDLFHDLILSDVIEGLEKRFIGVEFQNCKTIDSIDLPVGRVPDVVVRSPGSIKLAVELELTGKSEKRYRQILTSYRVNPRIERVLYITSKGVRDKLTKILAHRPVNGLPIPETGKFYFANLNELLRCPELAAITNGRDELSLMGIMNGKETA